MKELNFARIGQRIREIRMEQKLTQEYVANSAGVNVSHISNIETNKVKVSLTLLVEICNALNTTVDYVLEEGYIRPTDATEKELMRIIHNMEHDKQELLLRISKVI